MAKMTVKGLDQFEDKLAKLQNYGIHKAAERAVYVGADVIADRVRSNLKALPSISDAEAIKRYHEHAPGHLTAGQKKGLLDSLGVAPMNNDANSIDTHIGFDGYNEIVTKRYPSGQPNVMVARSVESGTSFMQSTPFIRPAVTAGKATAQSKMAQEFEQIINEIGG